MNSHYQKDCIVTYRRDKYLHSKIYFLMQKKQYLQQYSLPKEFFQCTKIVVKKLLETCLNGYVSWRTWCIPLDQHLVSCKQAQVLWKSICKIFRFHVTSGQKDHVASQVGSSQLPHCQSDDHKWCESSYITFLNVHAFTWVKMSHDIVDMVDST